MESNNYFRMAMKKKEMTPAEFSRYIGISDSYISKILKNKRNMDNYTCFHVAEILNINTDKLISMTNSEREKNEEKREFWQGKVKEYGFITHKMSLFLPSIMAIIGILALTLRDKMSAIGYEIYDLYLIVFSDLNIFVDVFNFLLLYRLCAVIPIVGRTPPQFCKA